MANRLVKDLQIVAARLLHNTRGVPQNMKDKVELIQLAFGHANVVRDFEQWCAENRARNPQYPVTEYLRSVDARLGAAERVDPQDARIGDLQALAYELTGILPGAHAIRDLIGLHDIEDIKAAFQEFVLGLDEKEVKSGVRSFFNDNGAGAVIAARKKRGL